MTTTDTGVRAADPRQEAAFAELTQRYRAQLRVHCYRLLGSFEESEDLVQETFLRAWGKRQSLQDDTLFRAWLYRIATNACLDAIDQRSPDQRFVQPGEGGAGWLQPFPDRLLDLVAPSDAEPDAVVVAKETIELAFLAAIQHLPPRQRAALILRDVLGWSAKEAASVLDSSVAAANSALQRARATLKERLPAHRLDWAPFSGPTAQERAVLRRYIDAIERADAAAIAAVLRHDAVCVQQPWAGGNAGPAIAVVTGREAILESWAPVLGGSVRLRFVATRANRQPAAATYISFGGAGFEAFALAVLSVEGGRDGGGQVGRINIFDTSTFGAFGLPAAL